VAPADDPYPFQCPNAVRDDDVDHVMTVVLDPARLRFPDGHEANPFVRYRTLFYTYHLAQARGMSDADYVALVERLDRAVADVDGHGFTVTPFDRRDGLGRSLGFDGTGGVWVKNETGNVSGSHKARHLMGLLLHLEVAERAGLAGDPARRARARYDARRLAIASCGNAALAAAVLARAGGRALEVFVPTWADAAVVAKLERLGARLTVCPREDGVPGDPTYHRLQRAISEGALPFTCQGPDNGLTIEGGTTLGYEIASALAAHGGRLDRLFIQVGGGALASACVQGLRNAVALGAMPRLPRIHAVQTLGGHPLRRAYDRFMARLVPRLDTAAGAAPPGSARDREWADLAHRYARSPGVAEEMAFAASHRSAFMWPWEEEPRSLAHGILDDETYDWMAVLRGMVETGGYPVVVSEDQLARANDLARGTTAIDVDHTGSSGLAGLLELLCDHTVRPDERVAVLFTGARRNH
jgi:threonine dehydratase